MTTQSTTQSLEEQTAQSGDHPTHKPCHPGRRALLLLLPCASSPSRTPPWLPCNLLPLHYLPLCSSATSIFPSDRDSQGEPPSVCPASPLWEDSRVLSSAHFPRPRILSQDTAVSGRRPPSVNRLHMQWTTCPQGIWVGRKGRHTTVCSCLLRRGTAPHLQARSPVL